MSSPKNLKMCQSCRGLIAANSSVCPLCGNESHYVASKLSGISVNWSLTTILLTLNVVIYVLVMAFQVKVWGLPVESSGMHIWPPASSVLDAFGAVYLGGIMRGQYWRLLTMCFLHSGLLHLGFNSYALFQIGQATEEAFGKAKFLCLYLVAGICGSLAVLAVNSVAIGASGAIFGVIGAMAVYGYKRGDMYGRMLKSSMVQWLVYGLVISFMPGISMAAHVGGLVGGAGMAYVMSDVEQTRQRLRVVRWWQAAAFVAVVLVLGSFALAALNVKKITEVSAVQELTEPVYNAALTYTRRQAVDEGETFDQYRGRLGGTVTTLEHTPAADDESAALRQRMLDILRARRDQLNQAKSLNDAPLDAAQRNALKQAFNEFEDWVRRKSQNLGIPENRLRPEWSFPEEERGAAKPEASRPPS